MGRKAAIAGVYNTAQGRRLEGETTRRLTVEAILGALADAGLNLDEVDGITSEDTASLIYDLRLGPVWQGATFGVSMVAAQAEAYRDHAATAPWTRPENEFVAPWGMFTAAEFALIARRHMEVYGTTREQLSIVASTIRNNGSANPAAVYHGRGPFAPDDITASRMIAEPFHLLDCATTSEGGCALVIANVERIKDSQASREPVYVLGSGADFMGPSYQHPPAWDLTGRRGTEPNGTVGRHAADLAFTQAGLSRDDVDVLELYDPFSFEIIRQLEAFRFCPDGEGGPFVEDGHIAITGSHPVTTDGGTMSFSHAGTNPQMMQRAIRGVQQIRGEAGDLQVPGAQVALCSNGGAGALFTTVLLLGAQPR
jgi:acetyl-CoA acetyltransferase